MSTYIPTQHWVIPAGESASTMANSVEILFPRVEEGTLIQIMENQLKPTNIYCFLANEKRRAESQRTISIGAVEFEPSERNGKEIEYRISSFFKVWTAYCGIIVKLAPHAVESDLATAWSIYTMNLYNLLEKYTREGVTAYHFPFHRKWVASGLSFWSSLLGSFHVRAARPLRRLRTLDNGDNVVVDTFSFFSLQVKII